MGCSQNCFTSGADFCARCGGLASFVAGGGRTPSPPSWLMKSWVVTLSDPLSIPPAPTKVPPPQAPPLRSLSRWVRSTKLKEEAGVEGGGYSHSPSVIIWFDGP